MNYIEEKNRIISIITHNGKIIQLNKNRSNEKQNYRDLTILDDNKKIGIKYPGYKTRESKCDYCVYLIVGKNEFPISHTEIMHDLYQKTTRENYNNIKRYIEDVAIGEKNIVETNYPGINFNLGFTFDELTNLMFYIGIQEDINYPEIYLQGRKMCFYRYIEAIYCKIYTNHSLADAINRAKAKNSIPTKWNDVSDLYKNISDIRR